MWNTRPLLGIVATSKVSARISPDVDDSHQYQPWYHRYRLVRQINFSLTDGDNLDFQIKKTGDDTAAMIVAKEGVDLELRTGTHYFELVVNEFGNAPANTSDIDVQVHRRNRQRSTEVRSRRAGKRNGC